MDAEAIKNKNNSLHGITLEKIITTLYEVYGWEKLALKLNVNCFKENQSIKSCLTFFRKTPWAREKLEKIYIRDIIK
jgi:uncharacterized protein (DUF2132 family)